MPEIFGIPAAALFGQLLIGLINGSFYALLSLGLAVIFGLLNIINFTHGAQYMLGAFCAYFLLQKWGLGYWWALLIAPIAVGITGMVIERTMLKQLYKLDHLYGLLLTFGLALIIQGLFRNEFGSSGQPYPIPPELAGGHNLGFMFLPTYRAWVIFASLVVCFATWFVIEKTRLGGYLRAATENPELVQAFGINVPRMITLTYGFGVGLAAVGILRNEFLVVSDWQHHPDEHIPHWTAAAGGLLPGNVHPENGKTPLPIDPRQFLIAQHLAQFGGDHRLRVESCRRNAFQILVDCSQGSVEIVDTHAEHARGRDRPQRPGRTWLYPLGRPHAAGRQQHHCASYKGVSGDS